MAENEGKYHILGMEHRHSLADPSFCQWSIFWPNILIYAPVSKFGKGLVLLCFRGISSRRILAATRNYYKTREYSAQRKLFEN